MKNRWTNTPLNFWNSTESSLAKEKERRKFVRQERLDHVRQKFSYLLSLPPTNTTVSQVIKELVLAWDKEGFSAFSINCGNCDDFANELVAIFPDGNAQWGEDCPELFPAGFDPEGHCFFSLNDRYYDSESPLGVKSPHELQFYQRDVERKETWNKGLLASKLEEVEVYA